MCIRDRVSFTRMQLNVNADVFESAVAWYAARTGPAAATTSAAVPSSTARERSHRPGDISGPPPAGTGVLAGGEAAGGGGEWLQSRGGPFTRPYRATVLRGPSLSRCLRPLGARSRPVRSPGPGRRGRRVLASSCYHTPRGREAGAIPAQSRYGDRRSRNGGSPVAGPAAKPHEPSRERGRQA